jgi:hypothetical protein
MIERVKYIIDSGENGINWMAIAPLIFFFLLLIAIFVVTLMRSKADDERAANLPLEGDDYDENEIY